MDTQTGKWDNYHKSLWHTTPHPRAPEHGSCIPLLDCHRSALHKRLVHKFAVSGQLNSSSDLLEITVGIFPNVSTSMGTKLRDNERCMYFWLFCTRHLLQQHPPPLSPTMNVMEPRCPYMRTSHRHRNNFKIGGLLCHFYNTIATASTCT